MATKAKESSHILKARRKLKRQFAEETKKVTAQALDKMNKSIRLWLKRHSTERMNLKDKSIVLFDANQHPAGIQSKFVRNLLSNLKSETGAKPLEGRITK